MAVAIATGPRPQRLSSTGWAVFPALLLLAVPFWEGHRTLPVPGRIRWDDRRRLACCADCFAAGRPPSRRVVTRRIGDDPGRPGDLGVPHRPCAQRLLERRNRRFRGGLLFAFGKESRPTGSLYDPNSLGNILALTCPVALLLAATARTTTARLLATRAALMIGVGLTLSLSRMSWIGAVAGAGVAIVLLPSPHRWRAGGHRSRARGRRRVPCAGLRARQPQRALCFDLPPDEQRCANRAGRPAAGRAVEGRARNRRGSPDRRRRLRKSPSAILHTGSAASGHRAMLSRRTSRCSARREPLVRLRCSSSSEESDATSHVAWDANAFSTPGSQERSLPCSQPG